jgi:sugar phosphate isomerase/epimerase
VEKPRIFCPIEKVEGNFPFLEDNQLGVEIIFLLSDYLYYLDYTGLNNLKTKLDRMNITRSVHAPFHGLNLGCEDLSIRSYSVECCSRAIQNAGILEADKVVVHTGFPCFLGPPWKQKWFEKFIDSVERLLDISMKHDIILTLENTWELTWEIFESAFARINDPSLKMTLDIAHAFLFSDKSPELWMEKFSDNIVHLHFTDTGGTDDNHMALGEGVIDWAKISESIDKLPNCVTKTLEIMPEDYLKSIPVLKLLKLK